MQVSSGEQHPVQFVARIGPTCEASWAIHEVTGVKLSVTVGGEKPGGGSPAIDNSLKGPVGRTALRYLACWPTADSQF